jgi:VanZ family protein
MGVLLYENRKRINTGRRLALVVLIPFIFGAVLELMQSWLTTSRTGSIYDLLFNLFGILFSIGIYQLAMNSGRNRIK